MKIWFFGGRFFRKTSHKAYETSHKNYAATNVILVYKFLLANSVMYMFMNFYLAAQMKKSHKAYEIFSIMQRGEKIQIYILLILLSNS